MFMSGEYNSELISRLYSVSNDNHKEAENILREIDDIRDPVFIDPLFDAYQRFKQEFNSHYFLSTLAGLQSQHLVKRTFDQIQQDISKGDFDNLSWLINILEKNNQYTEEGIQYSGLVILNFFKIKTFNDIDLGFALRYLLKAKALNRFIDDLYQIFILSSDEDVIRTSLSYYLKIEPKKDRLQKIINDIEILQSNPTHERILAKELVGWSGPKTNELKQLIFNHGDTRATEILKKEQKDIEAAKTQKEEKLKGKEIEEYGNFQLISEIYSLREKINIQTTGSSKFGFPLLNQNELLVKHTKVALSEADMIALFTDLRAILWGMNVDNLKKYSLNPEKIKELLPNSNENDINKPLNLLFLFLKSVDAEVDDSLFGFRRFNQSITLLGSHKELPKDWAEALKVLGIKNDWSNEDWAIIQSKILKKYKEGLEQLYSKIQKLKE